MILFLISGCGCIRFFKNLFGYTSFLREQWLYLMKTKQKDVTMQKCRDWIRRKDNRKKLLLPVLFFLFLMVGSLLCLPWLRQLMEKQEGWLILAKEHAPWAMLAVIGCITLQVVLAFLPGEPLELLTGISLQLLPVVLLSFIGEEKQVLFPLLAIGAIDSANTLLVQQQSGFPLFTVIPMLYLFSTLLLLFTAIYGFVRHRLR